MVIDNCFRTPKNRVKHLVLPEYRFLTTSMFVCVFFCIFEGWRPRIENYHM